MSTFPTTATRLAIDGGAPLVPGGAMMHSRWPRIEPDDIERIVGLLRSGLLTEMSGPGFVRSFEAELAMLAGTQYAMTTNSGTSALHCALAGAGVQAGDEVVVPALAYIACAAAVVHQHAIPVFADVDPLTYNLTPDSIRVALGERTRAIMVVHLHGLPADMEAIRALGDAHGIPIVEDFSQAVGARYHGAPVGGLGAVGATSLIAGKNLPSAGEGGVLVTDDREVRNRAAQIKCYGELVASDGSRQLSHATMGWNYRSSPIALALASQQLFRLDDYTEARRAGARELDATLTQIPGLSGPFAPKGHDHVYHMYRFRIDPKEAGLSVSTDQFREGLKEAFWAEGLPLIEFQNMPLPGHALLQRQVGYGRGCPWSCHDRDDLRYDIHDHPGALDAIRHSLVVGIPAQATICNPEVVGMYARCFEKVAESIGALERFAAGLPACAPWDAPARLF